MSVTCELLPLPRYPVGGAGDEDSYNTGWNECLSECRANVAYAAAAKDAELVELRSTIEALRAEVETWKNFARGNKELLQESVYRAEQLAEALRELKDLMLGQVKWEPCDCGCLQQRVPDGPHSVTWLRAAQQVELAIRKAQENDDEPTLD